MAVSYRKFNQSYEFELLADISENATITNRTGIYVAVGFSPTGKMDKSSVTDCSSIGGTIKASMSYNQGRNNQRLPKPTDGVNLTKSMLSNNTIYCSFIRNAKFSAFSDEFDLENDSYYLILAKGPAEKDKIKYHTMKLATPSFVSFTTISKERPLFYEKKYDLRSAHAVFMTIAWIGLVSIGILLPRYHKDSWPGRSIADKDIWLFLHMGLMSGAVILIHVAIVLIFIDVNGWVDAANKTANAHAVIGIIITIFITFQAAGGVLRPEPKSKVRYVFRYIHSNTGYVILAFALLNIYLGSLLQHGVPVWSGYILLVFILFYLWMQFGYALVRRPNQVYDKNYASKKLTLTELLFYAYIVMAVIFTIFLAALYGYTA